MTGNTGYAHNERNQQPQCLTCEGSVVSLNRSNAETFMRQQTDCSSERQQNNWIGCRPTPKRFPILLKEVHPLLINLIRAADNVRVAAHTAEESALRISRRTI